MDPFKITCVTCQARLTVRSAAAVGQILACPKCGSMVQVTAPAAAPRGPASAADKAKVITESAVAHPLALESFASAADVGAELDGLGPLGSASPPPPPPARLAAPTAAKAANAARGFGAAKLAAIIAGGAVAGAALVFAALSWLSSDPDPAASQPAATAAPAPSSGASPAGDAGLTEIAANPAATAPASDELAAPASAETNVVAQAASTVPPAADATADPFAPPPGDPADAAATDPAAAGATAPPAPPSAEDAAPAVAGAAPRLSIDPLELDPEGLDLQSLLHGAANDEGEAIAMSALPADAPAAASEAPAPADGEPPTAPGAAGEEFAAPAPIAAPGVLLARRFPGVTVEAMPLCRFLDFATALSAVPVSASPLELRLAAASSAAPVTVDVENATLEELLTAALKPLRLAPVVENGQIELRRGLAEVPRALAYPVDDLVSGDATALARAVQNLVEPESWRPHGGAGELTIDGTTLRINHAERVGYETILLLERYRLAAGLPPRSKYPAALLAAWAQAAKLDERLAGPATFTFSRPTPAREIFRWWQDELGVAVLVDWPALDAVRVAPLTRLTAGAAGQSWGEALDAALKPLGLGWRRVDARTMEITTLDKVEREPTLEFYRLAAGAESRQDEILARAQRPAANGVANDVAAGAAFCDAARRVLIVRQPAATQRKLAAWLAAARLIEPAP